MSAKRMQRPVGLPAHLHSPGQHACAQDRMARFAEGIYSIGEAARMTGLTRAQISKRLQYARKRGQPCSLGTPSC